MNQKISKNTSPRIKVIQKLYNALMNPEAVIEYPKSQYKKFIKDVVSGTLERTDLIETKINSFLTKDINLMKHKTCRYKWWSDRQRQIDIKFLIFNNISCTQFYI